MEPAPRYPDYNLLDRASRQIRLLRLLLDQDDAPLETQFEIHPLGHTPRYHALSYTWGEDVANESITIDGITVYVRTNACVFLHSMRRVYGECLVWMDCLCINQREDAEKNHQVELMGDIYRNAAVVHAWLGPSTWETQRVFDTALELRLRRRTPAHRVFRPWGDMATDGAVYWQRKAKCNVRPAIRTLLLRSYWTRVWILQELILAREVVFMCGFDIISSEDLERLCRVYSMADAYLDDLLLSKGYNTLAKVAEYRSKHAPPLVASFMFFLRNECTNPRDKVYAFRHMMDARQILPVDYAKCVLDVYMDMLRTGLLIDPQGIYNAGRLLTSMRESCSSLARSAKVTAVDYAPIQVSRSFRVVTSDHGNPSSSNTLNLRISFIDSELPSLKWNMHWAEHTGIAVGDIIAHLGSLPSATAPPVILIIKERSPGKFTAKAVVNSHQTDPNDNNRDCSCDSHCSVTAASWKEQTIEIDRLAVSMVLCQYEQKR